GSEQKLRSSRAAIGLIDDRSVLPAKIELATRIGRGFPGEVNRLRFEATLECVRVIHLVQVLSELNRVAVTITDQPLRGTKLAQSANTDVRQPAVARKLRNTLNTELRGNVGSIASVGLHARSVFAVKADAGLIDQGGSKRVCITESRALRIHLLISVSKSAAIGVTSKRAGNEAWTAGPAIPAKERVLRRDVFVDADIELVHIRKRVAVDVEIIVKARLGWSRHQAQQFDCIWIEPVRRDDVPRKRIAHVLPVADAARCRWIEDGTERIGLAGCILQAARLQRNQVREVREAAVAFQGGRHGIAGFRHALADARPFVVGKKEGLILDNAAAGRRAELILLEGALRLSIRILEEVGSVEFVIAQKFPERAMELVRTRFDTCIQHCTAGASELRAERAGLKTKLADGVNRRLDDIGCAAQEIDIVRVVIDAVEHVIVLRRTCPVRRKPAIRVQAAPFRLADSCTRNQTGEESVVAAI